VSGTRIAAICAAALVSVFGAAACGGDGEEEAQEVRQVEQRVEQLEQRVEEQQQQLEKQQELLEQQISETVKEEEDQP
jgi:flagellar motility protein MotE (MotC chaperone)